MGSTSVFYTTELRNDLQVQIISYNGDIEIDIRKGVIIILKNIPNKTRYST